MKTRRIIPLIICMLPAIAGNVFGQGTAFTYQGRLAVNGNAANGSYDLRFILYNSDVGGSQQGPILTNAATPVANGLFTVTLDFTNVFDGGARWLEIHARSNAAGAFVPMVPRQLLTPSPYAITAEYATTAGNIGGGGVITGNGAGLTNVNAATLGGLSSSNFWKTTGNSGTTAGANFLGTTDNQPVEIKAKGLRVLRLEPATVTNALTGGFAVFSNAPNVVAGADVNRIDPTVAGATIGGGGVGALNEYDATTNLSLGPFSNHISSSAGTIAGGMGHTVGADALFGTIGGGELNTIQAEVSTIAGGGGNTIGTNSYSAFIGAGLLNAIGTNASYAVVCGGTDNTNNGNESIIGGGINNLIKQDAAISGIFCGDQNKIDSSADNSAILGGWMNEIGDSAFYSAIGGGDQNSIGSGASHAVIVGGSANNASGQFSTILGGANNLVSGDYSVAVGRNCFVSHPGTFMWSDGTLPFGSQSSNSFYALATKGYYLYTGSGVGVQLAGGGNAWSALSDRNMKENFKPVNYREILDKVAALPVTTWNLKAQPPEIRHIGAMAQDFKAAFEVGEDERHISTSDADGVALAAIKGLNEKLDEKEAEIASLKKRLEVLEQRLARPAPPGNLRLSTQ